MHQVAEVVLGRLDIREPIGGTGRDKAAEVSCTVIFPIRTSTVTKFLMKGQGSCKSIIIAVTENHSDYIVTEISLVARLLGTKHLR